jgi:syntaxin-binding protein 1
VAYSDMNSNREKKIRGRISDKFIEIFRNLSFYQVNLYYKKSISGIAERMAETISEDFKEFIKTLRMEKSSILSENAENVEVLLIDRSIDPVTPLLHDFFYESMLFDLENLQLVYFPTKE